MDMIIWRVRYISCDGGRIGNESMEFFFQKEMAEKRMQELIEQSNKRNPKYLFETKTTSLDGVVGYCNWQFMNMLAVDSVKVK